MGLGGVLTVAVASMVILTWCSSNASPKGLFPCGRHFGGVLTEVEEPIGFSTS